MSAASQITSGVAKDRRQIEGESQSSIGDDAHRAPADGSSRAGLERSGLGGQVGGGKEHDLALRNRPRHPSERGRQPRKGVGRSGGRVF